MLDHKDFYSLLNKNGLIEPIWESVLDLLEGQIEESHKKETALNLFVMYFSLIGDGNIGMPLDGSTLSNLMQEKLKARKILLESNDEPINEKELISLEDTISECAKDTSILCEASLPNLIGEKRLFYVDKGFLYASKYQTSRIGVGASLKRLFLDRPKGEIKKVDYSSWCGLDHDKPFELSKGDNPNEGQEAVLNNGLGRNLIITGGPGTGKTTSVLFLLLTILMENKDYVVYLVAPSGKASSRMKESIVKNLAILKDDFKTKNKDIISKIENLDTYTIHRLLEPDYQTNGFRHNADNRFGKDSIFVIDEASMIDICLFDALLSAIPDEARVFIMGDKNQLPSVECGAVFGALLDEPSLKPNIIHINESKRFEVGSPIFNLAASVNNGSTLPVEEAMWRDYENFEILDGTDYPIYYFLNQKEGVKQKEIVLSVIKKWGISFYKNLQEKATDIVLTDDGKANEQFLGELFDLTEKAKILCAENLSVRGVKTINQTLRDICIDKTKETSFYGFYPGMLMMINTNNKSLDLFNGDSGILVTFKGDKTIYFMVKKKTELLEKDGEPDDALFKIGDYVFYPLRMIAQGEIDLAYAITIHKSQGFDYNNILIILPDKEGHPLLNRQIVYTAITRTKGSTYILARQDLLEYSKKTLVKRITNIAF